MESTASPSPKSPQSPPAPPGKRRSGGEVALNLPPGAPLRGTPYVVVTRLGTGGTGAVFEIEHRRLRKRLAAKMLHPGLRSRETFLARMDIEAQTLARLSHPNIVDVHDLGVTSDGIPFFVMEKLEGSDLRRILRQRGRVSVDEALGMVADALDGLEHAHRQGVIHRDIKPENLFAARVGDHVVTKILDFGIAKLVDNDENLTGDHFLGTPQYASPELLRCKPLTPKADLYAMGCVLFELVSGRRPFPGPTLRDYAYQHIKRVPPRIAEGLDVPAELDALVASALSKNPDDRPASAHDFAVELRRFRRDLRKSERARGRVPPSKDAATVEATSVDVVSGSPKSDDTQVTTARIPGAPAHPGEGAHVPAIAAPARPAPAPRQEAPSHHEAPRDEGELAARPTLASVVDTGPTRGLATDDPAAFFEPHDAAQLFRTRRHHGPESHVAFRLESHASEGEIVAYRSAPAVTSERSYEGAESRDRRRASTARRSRIATPVVILLRSRWEWLAAGAMLLLSLVVVAFILRLRPLAPREEAMPTKDLRPSSSSVAPSPSASASAPPPAPATDPKPTPHGAVPTPNTSPTGAARPSGSVGNVLDASPPRGIDGAGPRRSAPGASLGSSNARSTTASTQAPTVPAARAARSNRTDETRTSLAPSPASPPALHAQNEGNVPQPPRLVRPASPNDDLIRSF